MSLIMDALRRADGTRLPVSDHAIEAEATPSIASRYVIAAAVFWGGLVGGASMMWIGSTAPLSGVTSPISVPRSTEVLATASRGDSLAVPPEAVVDHAKAHAVADSDMRQQTTPAVRISDDRKQGAESLQALNRQMWNDAALHESEATAASDSGGVEAPPETLSASLEPTATLDQPSSMAPPIDLARAIERLAQEVGDVPLSPHPATLLENLSQQQKDQIPTIVYGAHAFFEAGDRSVTLNGRRLQAGQRTEEIQVVEVLHDSVVLNAGGIVFRLRALNSWVNL
ncbi:MAG: general secretion pathway protein GspB [Luminiphilus sp.]|nr:general secretion pathway protein GspB [Luminiphilus sp.]